MPQNLQQLIKIFIDIATSLMPILGGVALLVFFWGLVKFIAKSGDEKSHQDGRSLMVWGLIALFVMVSFLGIVYLFYDDLGFNSVKPFGLPTLPE
ncbi:MAG: hypothetical protein AAB690_02570 [Patescibacteria group bacterium]